MPHHAFVTHYVYHAMLLAVSLRMSADKGQVSASVCAVLVLPMLADADNYGYLVPS